MENIDVSSLLGSIWLYTILISFVIGFLSFFWGMFDLFFLLRFEGEIKRGFKVWSKPLSNDIKAYLLSIHNDVVEVKKGWFSERKIGFIRVENGEFLIQYRRPHWSTSWPYIGYVDLSESEPTLQFRSSLPMHLFLLPFVLTLYAIPFIVIGMIWNYYMESTAIESFIRRKIVDNSQ